MKIAVVGLGYVGLANAVLLSLNNRVYAVDIDLNRGARNKESALSMTRNWRNFLLTKF